MMTFSIVTKVAGHRRELALTQTQRVLHPRLPLHLLKRYDPSLMTGLPRLDVAYTTVDKTWIVRVCLL